MTFEADTMPDVNSNDVVSSDPRTDNNLNNHTFDQVITILHFNDCYNVEPRTLEPAGGAARFKSALKSFDSSDPIVLFSGDILGPSISTYKYMYTYIYIYSDIYTYIYSDIYIHIYSDIYSFVFHYDAFLFLTSFWIFFL